MKKLLIFILVSALCLSLVTPVSAAEEIITDERTGVKYTLSYRTIIQCHASGKDYGNSSIQAFPGYQVEYFYASPDSPEVLAGISKMESKITDKFDTLTSKLNIADDRWLLDGYEYTYTGDYDYYWRFFDLPRDYKGTTVITRGDVPFTVTSDGQGKLSYKVVTDYIGKKYAEFYIPSVVSHTKTVTKTESYTLIHPGLDTGPFNTLDEVLDYCNEHINYISENTAVKIATDIVYTTVFSVTLTPSCTLQVTYGNTASVSNSKNNSNN